jgi:hypothetical protein
MPQPEQESFASRFNINIDVTSAQNVFTQRAITLLKEKLHEMDINIPLPHWERFYLTRAAYALGRLYQGNVSLEGMVLNNFMDTMKVLESLYNYALERNEAEKARDIAEIITRIIRDSDIGLGITWRNGVFIKEGAKLLDEKLIDEPYQWLSSPEYNNVLVPFKKGIDDFLSATNHPERLVDVVRDMYVALEKMARIVCNNENNLGANTEQFVIKLQLSAYYESMLRKHTEYAHTFRHADKGEGITLMPQPNEVEAFVYTTGLFIRLAIHCLKNN